MERLSPAQRPQLHCTTCDAPQHAGADYCTACGTPLGPTRRPVVAPAQPAHGPRCNGCGVVNPAIARYCVGCGLGLGAGGALPGLPLVMPALNGAGAGTLVQHIYIAAPATTAPVALWVRALWFLCVGLWLGQVWLLLAWLCNLTLLGLPIGMRMLGAMPAIMTLRQEQRGLRSAPDQGAASFAVRAIYFVVIGWWISLIWLQLAWLAAATIIGLPLAFAMFERVNAIMTLADG